MRDRTLPQLRMRLWDLNSLPPVELTNGYVLRSFEHSSDGQAWEQIIDDSFRDVHHFQEDMSKDEHFRPERVKFIFHGEEPVATASAWARENDGYLHMVGVHSKHLGHGLGKQVSLAALHEMRAEGRTSAILDTDDFRLPAIKTYLKLGFMPQYHHESHIERWRDILPKVNRTDLLAMIPANISDNS